MCSPEKLPMDRAYALRKCVDQSRLRKHPGHDVRTLKCIQRNVLRTLVLEF
jgi:hypothetical protein